MAPAPQKKSHGGKIILIVLAIFAAGAAGFGYFTQTNSLRSNSTEAAELSPAEQKPLAADDALFQAKPTDIVIGKADAPNTIVEYSSLTCPHCAHFHETILPDVKKQLLDTGKAKLILRHFPLNEPALRGAQLVECAGGNKRIDFAKVLFSLQKNWGFSDNFKNDLKKIAAQGGIDSAEFTSCLNDKSLEDSILATRQEAATRAHVNSTPSFFVNGVALDDFSSAAKFSAAIEKKPTKKEAAAK